MSNAGQSESTTTFFPLEANDVARLVPLAIDQIGWQIGLEGPAAEQDASETWTFTVSTGGLAPKRGAVIVERRARLWTAVRFCWTGAAPVAERDCERFLRSLVLLSDAPDP
jgi:hypothetical protein